MRIEHFALNVKEPNAAARWYVEHLGFKVKRRLVEPPYTHFLTDDDGVTMLEIYHQTIPVIDFQQTHSMSLHIALTSNDVAADARRLVGAGASEDGELTTLPTGDCFAMVRDPWGITWQLISRKQPMV